MQSTNLLAQNLTKTKVGFEGVILSLQGSPLRVERLHELGFTRGEKIAYRATTLFQDPMIVEVRGAVIALRREEAHCIQVA